MNFGPSLSVGLEAFTVDWSPLAMAVEANWWTGNEFIIKLEERESSFLSLLGQGCGLGCARTPF